MTATIKVDLDTLEKLADELDATAARVSADLARLPEMVEAFGKAVNKAPLRVGLSFPLERATDDLVEAWPYEGKPDADLHDARDLVALARFAIRRTRDLEGPEGRKVPDDA